LATTIPLTVDQANDVTVTLAVYESDGVTPQDLTGMTVELVIKRGRRLSDVNATVLTVGAGLTVVSLPGGLLTAFFPHSTVTAAAGTFWYRLDVLDGSGGRTTAIDGILTVSPC